VEWSNVSGGVEADPDWGYLNPEVVRSGYAYVAVSAQAFGVDGGKALLGRRRYATRCQQP
jgi:Alpha/beta hydrolase domain